MAPSWAYKDRVKAENLARIIVSGKLLLWELFDLALRIGLPIGGSKADFLEVAGIGAERMGGCVDGLAINKRNNEPCEFGFPCLGQVSFAGLC